MKYGYLWAGALLGGLLLAPITVEAAVSDVKGGEVRTQTDWHTNVKGHGDAEVRVYRTVRDQNGNEYSVYDHSEYHSTDIESGFLKGTAADPVVIRQQLGTKIQLLAWAHSVGRNGVGFDGHVYSRHSKGFVVDGIDDTSYTSSRSVSEGAILIGDVDNLATAYAAHEDTFEKLDNYQVYQINLDCIVSPIVLDLDGDGKLMASDGQYLPHPKTFKSEGAVMFDFYGNGFPVATEWVGLQDGLLCRPQEGQRLNGTHLFSTSNGYDNGYEEMASLDQDKSGALEGAELEGLCVWQDRDGNGRADEGELQSVQELGITSINVNHKDMASTFVRNGKTYKSFDWWPSIKDVRRVDISNLR